jgi:hypothetical protein
LIENHPAQLMHEGCFLVLASFGAPGQNIQDEGDDLFLGRWLDEFVEPGH